MSDEPDSLPEEQLTSWLAACDDALAAGGAPTFLDGANVSPELRDRVERDLECLHLLDQLRPRPDQPGAAPPAAAPTPLRSLGRFQIRRQLGRGGFGVVFLAYDPQLGREVALKVPRVDVLLHPELRLRFYHEARAAAALDHPHIVQVYEAGEIDSVCFIASAYHPGVSLAAWLKQQSHPVPFPLAAELVATLAEAVQHAHSRGVLHRDLKSGNILLSSPHPPGPPPPPVGEGLGVGGIIPTIADFGLAKLLSGEDQGQTQTGDIVGTPCYMSPEQAAGKTREISTATDVYGLGAILYELLTRRPPFLADTSLETVRLVVTEEPVPPSRLRAKVPRDLETICLKCLQKDVSRRYPSAQQLADDLGRFLRGEPVRARPIGMWERAARWARRRPAAAALLVVSVVAALALATVGLSYHLRLRSALETAEERRLRLRSVLETAEERRLHLRSALATAEERRQQADTNLYHSLIREARATRLARAQGYRKQVWALLRQARQLKAASPNLDHLRQEAVACLGDFVGLEPAVITGFAADLQALTHHPTESQLAVGLKDGTVWLIPLKSPDRRVRVGKHSAPVTQLWFAQGGRRLIFGDANGALGQWQADAAGKWRGGKAIPMRFYPNSMAVSADGKRLAGAPRGLPTVVLHDLASARTVRTLRGDGEGFYRTAFSQGSDLLAGASYAANRYGLRVWEVTTGKTRLAFSPDLGPIHAVAFAPAGGQLACACEEGVVLVNPHGGPPRVLHGDTASSVAFSPDGQWVASVFWTGVVRLWNRSRHREAAVLRHPRHDGGKLVAFSDDGRALIVASTRSVQVWNLAGSGEKLVLPGHVRGVPGIAFSLDGKLLASCGKDRTVRLWNPARGEARGKLAGFSSPVQTVAFGGGGRFLATGENAGLVQLWDVASGRARQVSAPELSGQVIASVAFSPRGRYFAAGGQRGLVLWRIRENPLAKDPLTGLTLQRIARLSDHHCGTACFSPDERLLVWASAGRVLGGWDLENGRPRPMPRARLTYTILSLAFHPDSRHVTLVGASKDAEMWDLAAGSKTTTLGRVREGMDLMGIIALSPDGTWLAAASARSSEVAVCTTAGQAVRFVLPDEPTAERAWSLAWSPDGDRLAVGLSDGGIVVWSMPQVRAQLARAGLGW